MPPTSDRLSARDLGTQAVWFALVIGLIEGGFFIVRSFGFHDLINLSPDVLWMSPAAYLVWFGGTALVVGLLSHLWPGIRTEPAALRIFAFLAWFSLLGIRPHLFPIAHVVLAAGLATLTERLVRSRRSAVRGLMARTVGWLGAAVFVIAMTMVGWRWWEERRSVSQLGAAPAGAPNILLLVLDTVRALDLSLYGYDRPTTPELAKWAARGVRFDQAIATAPWTLSSHASMFTGRYPFELSADWGIPLDGTFPTLAEVLQKDGYVTAGFVANPIFTVREYGLARGFAHFEDLKKSPGEFFMSTAIGRFFSGRVRLRALIGGYNILGRKTANEVNEELLTWLPRRGSRPFFAFLNYYDAHFPYLPTQPYRGRFGDAGPRLLPQMRHHLHDAIEFVDSTTAPVQVARERAAYDECIASLDAQVGDLLKRLEERGILRNTLVVITADHGEMFGEHGVFYHSNKLYRPVLQVPLVLLWEGKVPAGAAVRTAVSLRDLPATMLDLAGLSEGAHLPGASLAGLWHNGGDSARSKLSPALSQVRLRGGKIELQSLVQSSYQFLEILQLRAPTPRPGQALYDLTADPEERRDLSTSDPGQVALLRQTIQAVSGRRLSSAPH